MGFIASMIPVAAEIGTSIWNTMGQRDANARNIALQREINTANIGATNATNAANITLQRETNQQNREWALEDWYRTNQYNSPQQMMARFKEAGLNPHMIYGNGAQTTAASMAKPDSKAPALDAPNKSVAPRVSPVTFQAPDILTPFMQRLSLDKMQAETDNLKKANSLLDQKATVNDLQIAGLITKNAQSQFDYDFAREMRDTTKEKAMLQNQYSLAATEKAYADIANVKASTDYTRAQTKMILPEFELKQAEFRLREAKNPLEIQNLHADLIKKMFEYTTLGPEQVKKLKEEVDNLKNTGALQKMEMDLKQGGYNQNDPAYIRVLQVIAMKLARKYGYQMDDYTK